MIIRIFDPTEPGLQASMLLTPAPARERCRFHLASQNLARLVAVVFFTACVRTTTPAATPPVRPATVTPPPPLAPVPNRSAILAPDSAVYDVTSTVIGSDLDTPAAVPRDSVIYHEVVATSLIIGRDSSVLLAARSDSGYELPRGRELPAEIAAKPKGAIQVSVQRALQTQQLSSSSPTMGCSSAATLLSPLMPALALRFALETTRESRMVRDSLSYNLCQAGVPIRFTLQIVPDSAPSVQSADGSLRYRITGTVSADSSRALPMRLKGTVSGNASLQRQPDVHVLPAILTMTLQTDLSFGSSTRTQRIQQMASTRFVRR